MHRLLIGRWFRCHQWHVLHHVILYVEIEFPLLIVVIEMALLQLELKFFDVMAVVHWLYPPCFVLGL